MAPLMDDRPAAATTDVSKPRLLIIGAGSRGNAYARGVLDTGLGIVAGVVEPVHFKRQRLGSTYIWQGRKPSPDEEFNDWNDFIGFEQQRRKDEAAGVPTHPGIDGVFICVRDDMHVHVVTALAPLGLHIMCEKPLATTLSDCLQIQRTLSSHPPRIFAIGHVLRYSPHNMLLRHLALEQKSIGDILSMEHTEPIGWWHYSHSYVRGQWRKEKLSAPSLLTKSCHDIDFIMWMLCSPLDPKQSPHLPSHITSTGSLKQFVHARKPREAGKSTNCMSCPLKDTCLYSAPRIYYDRHLAHGDAKWPIDIIDPVIPALLESQGLEKAKEALFEALSEDYDPATTPVKDIEDRQWYGRCVWESDNDVCDDQNVTITWPDTSRPGQHAKTAIFHMIAQTLAQCERRGRLYGTHGEISYDSKSITVHDFPSNTTKTYSPEIPTNSHHGGGDAGLTQQFLTAISAVKEGRSSVENSQVEYMGVTVEEVVRSHAAVFAAEEARRMSKVVEWDEWWGRNMDGGLQ